MDTTVRTAIPDDSMALAQLRRSWTDEGGTKTEDPAFGGSFAAWLATQETSRTFWIAQRGERPVGMVNLFTVERMPSPGRADTRWGYLGNLFVLPDFRRSGVGTLLVGAVLDDAARRRLERVIVHPNDQSLHFWRHAAFKNASDLLAHDLR